MRIVGHGLIARSLEPYAEMHRDVVAMAAGVAASTSTEGAAFERERRLLKDVTREARSEGLKIVYFSGGGAIYSDWTTPVDESTPPSPRSPYGRHQLECEHMIVSSGVRHLIVRLPNVVGPSGNPEQLIPSLVTQCLAGHVRVHGRATRDLLDAEDMAGLVVALLGRTTDREMVIVASGESTPVTVIVDEICAISGSRPQVETVDVGDAQRFDVSRLNELIGRRAVPADGYCQRVLRRYVPLLARGLVHARA